MITLSTNGSNPASPSAGHISEGASRIVADAPKQAPAPEIRQGAETQPSPEQLSTAVREINQALQQSNRNLEISVDNDTRRPIVKLVDTQTGEMIRQIPSEETLAISRSIDQFQQRQGMLFSEKA